MTAEKSNSSYGTWAVRVSSTEIKFFWRKAEALAFIADRLNCLRAISGINSVQQ